MSADEIHKVESSGCDEAGREVWQKSIRAIDDWGVGPIGITIGSADKGPLVESNENSIHLNFQGDIPIEAFRRQAIVVPSEAEHPISMTALSDIRRYQKPDVLLLLKNEITH